MRDIPYAAPDRFDDQLSALADSERRSIVRHLQTKGSRTATLDELAAVLEPDSDLERDHARIRLHHTHLPKLDETPLLTYRPEFATVEYHGDAEFEALLDILPDLDADADPGPWPPHVEP